MNLRRFRMRMGGLVLLIGAGLVPATSTAVTQGKGQASLEGIPARVRAALKAKFARAEVQKWTREKEGDIVVYDIEFQQDGGKFEADIREDGTIHNWEREIGAQALPAAVAKAVEARYPNSTFQEVMVITAVKDGKDEPEGYEIVLETAAKKGVEVTVSPEGRIVEDSGAPALEKTGP